MSITSDGRSTGTTRWPPWPNAGWRERVEAEVSRLAEALARTTRDVIVVSNEVGSGIVPATPSGRLYRDELGRLNQLVAATADRSLLLVAGRAQRLENPWDLLR